MDAVQEAVKRINSLASLERTTFSKVTTDWVLDINCYDTTTPDSTLEFDMKQGLVTGKLCVPCDNPTASDVKGTDAAAVVNVKNLSGIGFQGAQQKHSASLLSTCSLSFPGYLDPKKLSSFLDDLLFGNGARVGGGYRQPNITHVNLLEDNMTSSSTAHSSSNKSDEDVFIFSSAPKPVIDNTKNDGNVAKISPHSAVKDDKDDMMVYRIKGILHVHGQERLQILQGVFDVFEVKPSSFSIGGEGDASGGLSRVVVIGRNIDRDEIEDGFLSCLTGMDLT